MANIISWVVISSLVLALVVCLIVGVAYIIIASIPEFIKGLQEAKDSIRKYLKEKEKRQ